MNVEIQKAKQRIKDLENVKKQHRKLKQLEKEYYKLPPIEIFSDWINTICLTFENMVRKP